MGALTGTADQTTQETIRKVLCMRPDCSTVYVSPNRLNLRFSVKKVTKDVQLKELKWLVNLIKEDGINCPKTIIFCNTMNEIAVVVNHLILELGRAVFYPEFSTVQDNCILGIYHSNSWQSTKDRVLAQFTTNGVKRILVIVLLHIKSWMPQLNLLNLFTTVAHIVQPFASVVVHNVMELICLLRVACKRKAEVTTAMPSRGR